MTSKSEGQAALEAAVTLRDVLVAEGGTWAVERVERQIAQVRQALQGAVAGIREAYGIPGNEAVQDLLDVAAALLDLGALLNASRARVVSWTMPATGNAGMAAFWLYRDVNRRTEIVSLNRLPDPNRIAVGSVLRVYER